MKRPATWHLEAAVIGSLFALGWAVDQVVAGKVDAWTILGLLVLYIGTRLTSIDDRVKERNPSPNTATVHCYALRRRYDLASFVLGLGAACKPLLVAVYETLWRGAAFVPASAGALALAGIAVKIGYPRWRKWYRTRHPVAPSPRRKSGPRTAKTPAPKSAAPAEISDRAGAEPPGKEHIMAEQNGAAQAPQGVDLERQLAEATDRAEVAGAQAELAEEARAAMAQRLAAAEGRAADLEKQVQALQVALDGGVAKGTGALEGIVTGWSTEAARACGVDFHEGAAALKLALRLYRDANGVPNLAVPPLVLPVSKVTEIRAADARHMSDLAAECDALRQEVADGKAAVAEAGRVKQLLPKVSGDLKMLDFRGAEISVEHILEGAGDGVRRAFHFWLGGLTTAGA